MLTADEKTAIQSALGGFSGASAEIIRDALNVDGSSLAQLAVTIPITAQKVNVHKAILLSHIGDEGRAAVRAFMATDDGADFKMLYDAADEFTVNHPTTIEMLDMLQTGLGIDMSGVKAYGQRVISRAEELIGRKITIEDIEEARK